MKNLKQHHNCGYYPILIFGDVSWAKPGWTFHGSHTYFLPSFFSCSHALLLTCVLLYNIINEHKNVPNWPNKTSIITWNLYLFELKYYNYGEHIDQYGYQSLQAPHSYVDDGEDVVEVVLNLGCSIVTSDRDYGHVPWNHAQWRLLVGFVSISEYMKISQHTTKYWCDTTKEFLSVTQCWNVPVPKCDFPYELSRHLTRRLRWKRPLYFRAYFHCCRPGKYIE